MIAIDLGSNTIRFIEFNGVQWGKSFEKIVKTAESLNLTQHIGKAAIRRIVTAIHEAKTIIDFEGKEIVAYTTAAMRLASNASDVLSEIGAATGIYFQIIDAKKEAELTLLAVQNRLEMLGNSHNSFMLVDIGGGSTEFIFSSPDKTSSISLNYGIVTISEGNRSVEELNLALERFQHEAAAALPKESFDTLVLSAGTPTTIAAYRLGMDYSTYDPEKVNGYCLRLDECNRVYDALLKMEESERIRYVGVGRENLIMAGILMVTSVYRLLEKGEATVIDDGLREGIALEYFSKK